MSLIIKGLDMPKKGERYNIILLDDGSVTTFKLDNKRVYESFKNNPLEKHEAIQIERPHGRLIDGDAFIEYQNQIIQKHKHDDEFTTLIANIILQAVNEDLSEAPTILEAEE